MPTTAVAVASNRDFFERQGFSASRARKLSSLFEVESVLIARPGTDAPEETLVFPAALQAAQIMRGEANWVR